MITVTLRYNERDMDIMVKESQRIEEVLVILQDNNRIHIEKENLTIYSRRKQEYVNKLLTFQKAEIYSGDVLVLKY